MALMTVKGLKKSYPGVKALNGIDMELDPKMIFGLLGPNTSGKTTLLKTIAGLLRKDSGIIVYPGNASGLEARKTISLLPDSMVFPPWMRVKDAFNYYRDVYPDFSARRMEQMTQLLELPLKTPIRKLSKGMQERTALALTFSRQTQIYLLDEPLGGIDPVGKAKILEAILQIPLDNSSILLSTHLVKDVETIFDSVFFISKGKIIFTGGCESIREERGKTVEQVYLEVFSGVETN